MTESKKKPPVMTFEQAEMRRRVARNNVLRAQARTVKKEAKKAKKVAREGITGRDGYILSEALATAITALSRLKHPPESNIADMKEILAEWYPDGGFGYLIESAERRLAELMKDAA